MRECYMYSLIVRFNFFQIYIILVEYNTGIPVMYKLLLLQKKGVLMEYFYVNGRHTATGKNHTWSITWGQYEALNKLAKHTGCIDKMLIASVVSAFAPDWIPRAAWVEVTGFGRQMSKLKDPQPMLSVPIVVKKKEIENYMSDYFKDNGEDEDEDFDW